MPRLKMKPMAMACKYACYAIGVEYDERKVRESVWKHLRSTSAA